MKLLHVITDLDRGGAEIMLLRVLPRLQSRGWEQRVICLSGPGEIGRQIQAAGFSVTYLNMKRATPSFAAFFRLMRILRQESPDLIHSWLYHADLYTSLANRFVRKPLVWGLHNSTLGREAKGTTKWIVRLLARLSHTAPARILSCSRTAIQVHQAAGYRQDILRFVPNGFDIDHFCPDEQARKTARQDLGLSAETILIGNISRFDQQKNHAGLIRAWGLLAETFPQARFLLAGKDLTAENTQLTGWLEAAGIRDRVLLLGIRSDVPALLNALDLMVLSSNSGEAFPLIIGEAMSCGTLCVGTDVGDTAFLIADCGWTVPPEDDRLLAEACAAMLRLSSEEKAALKQKSRARIAENFTLDQMTAGYDAVYRETLGR